jgi:DNA-binding transcriptional MerR regulator
MKAPDAFRTISEVAEDLDLPQHVLRFWETRFNQIKPMKRGGGRRYYRPEDVDLLRGIRLLLYGEGFTIRGVQRLLKEKGVGFVAAAGQAGSVQTVTAHREEAERRPERPPKRAAQERIEPAMGDELDPGLAPSELKPESAFEAIEETGQETFTRPAQPASAPVTPAVHQPTYKLPVQDRRRLDFVLADLEEAKRLLDQARAPSP